MENDFMQQPTVLIVALVISIIVFVVTIGIVVSLFRAKDTFTDTDFRGNGIKQFKKKRKTQVSQ